MDWRLPLQPLYVSGKINEAQLDRQRRFITERLENLRVKVSDYRARQVAEVEKQALTDRVIAWAGTVREGLDDLTSEERREILNILLDLLDQVTVDNDNRVNITMAIPIGDFDAIEQLATSWQERNSNEKVRYSWAVDLDATV